MKPSLSTSSLSQKVRLMAALGLVAVAGISVSARGDENTVNDPAAAVRNYIDAFNKADVERMAAAFVPSGSILDGMAPHVWRAPNAARNWYRDAMTEAEHHGVTEHLISVSQPLHNDVTGTSAYVVVPASFTYKRGGKLIKQTGAFFTVALTQVKGAWRIASWAWTKGNAQ